MKTKPNKALYVAMRDMDAAVDKFAEAMRSADVNYITMRFAFTTRMNLAWEEYKGACARLNSLLRLRN